MNKELKLLLVSIVLMLVGSIALGLSQRPLESNCWSKYKTEREAILACEGES